MTPREDDGHGDYEFLTTDEVLGYLRINARTVYRLIRTHDLPAVRIGRQWRIRRCDLDSWLDGQRAGEKLPHRHPHAWRTQEETTCNTVQGARS